MPDVPSRPDSDSDEALPEGAPRPGGDAARGTTPTTDERSTDAPAPRPKWREGVLDEYPGGMFGEDYEDAGKQDFARATDTGTYRRDFDRQAGDYRRDFTREDDPALRDLGAADDPARAPDRDAADTPHRQGPDDAPDPDDPNRNADDPEGNDEGSFLRDYDAGTSGRSATAPDLDRGTLGPRPD